MSIQVARFHRCDVGANGFDDTGGLVAEQEREVVVDRALAIVQVGMADTARLHVDQRLTRARIGHLDRLDRDRLALALRDDPTYSMRHEAGAYRRRRGQAGGTSSGGSVT